MNKHRQITAYKDESRLFYMALTLLVVIFFAYAYFVSTSIAYVVMRKEVDTHISTLGTEVGQLEARYIEMQHSVSSDIAIQKGYTVAVSKVFIDKSVDTLVVSRN